MNNLPTLSYLTILQILTCTFLTLQSFNMYSQEGIYCGTTIDEVNYDRLVQLNKRWMNRGTSPISKAYEGTTYFVPVRMHLIRQDSGLGGATEVEAMAALERMNEYYIDASIHFYHCGDIDLIDNSTYYDYDKSQMTSLSMTYGQVNVVNIYVANSATNSSGSLICGHAEFPGGLDFMMVTTSCMNNGSTLAHEMGHYLGLYHTHSTLFGDEAVNGSDCATQGDLICDTPADPNLSGEVNNDGCIYEGMDTDENGEFYTPQVTNLMSYTRKECRFEVTEGQLEKALWTLQNERTYLQCTPPPLAANFYVRHEESCDNSKIFSFYNTSEGNVTSYNWDFGDGIGTSTDESPQWIYWANGVYTVTLTISDGISASTYSRKVTVGPVSIPYTNNFDAGSDDLSEFVVYNSMKNVVLTHADAAESGAFGLLFHGKEDNSTTPSFQTPNSSEAFQELWNPYFRSRAELCVDASNVTDLQLKFDKRQLRTSSDNYTYFVVTVNGQEEGSIVQVNSAGTDDPNFTNLTYDLSAYNNQVITIGFEGTHRYGKDRNGTNNGTATFIDNISISGVLSTKKVHQEDPLLFPNPAETILSVQLNGFDYSILDMLGKDVTHLSPRHSQNGEIVQLDISLLSSGTYFIQTQDGIARFNKQ